MNLEELELLKSLLEKFRADDTWSEETDDALSDVSTLISAISNDWNNDSYDDKGSLFITYRDGTDGMAVSSEWDYRGLWVKTKNGPLNFMISEAGIGFEGAVHIAAEKGDFSKPRLLIRPLQSESPQASQ